MTETLSIDPLAVPIAEGALIIRRHKTWLYRKVYSGEIKVCKNFGRLMIPLSELEKFVSEVGFYSPRKGTGRGRKPKADAALQKLERKAVEP